VELVWRNDRNRWGIPAKAFHWITVVLVAGMAIVGVIMADMPLGVRKLELYGLHKSFGIAVLAFTLLRLAWRWVDPPPGPAGPMRPWETALARSVHAALYGVLIAMPITGWLMSSAANFSVSVFGLFTLPDLIGPDPALEKTLKATHGWLAVALGLLVALHVVGAVRHHVMLGDDTLRRMLPGWRGRTGVGAGVLVIAALASGAAAAADAPARWQADPEASRITFEGTQLGAAFEGRFGAFTADIAFDPDNLVASYARVRIDAASIDTGNAERDQAARGPDWLHAAEHPEASFETTTIRGLGNGRFEAEATLTLRGETRTVRLRFTVEFGDEGGRQVARMAGTVDISRTDFGVGQGQWATDGVVGDRVQIRVEVVAHPAP